MTVPFLVSAPVKQALHARRPSATQPAVYDERVPGRPGSIPRLREVGVCEVQSKIRWALTDDPTKARFPALARSQKGPGGWRQRASKSGRIVDHAQRGRCDLAGSDTAGRAGRGVGHWERRTGGVEVV